MTDLLAVAPRAICGRLGVMRVVTDLAGVTTGRDDLRGLVVARAGPRLEVVWLVAARAGAMTRRERVGIDVERALLHRMTSFAATGDHGHRALRQRRLLALVHAVTIETAVEARMLRLAALMATRA